MRFRVYDKQEKKYIDLCIECFLLRHDGILLFFDGDDFETCDPDRYVVEFSTGLKDKNGVEIFCGDILNTKTTYQNNMADKRFQDMTEIKVVFDNGCFIDDYSKLEIFDKYRNGRTDFEIIGNINGDENGKD